VYVSTVIDSPVESVWAVVGSFFDLSWAGIPSEHECTPPSLHLPLLHLLFLLLGVCVRVRDSLWLWFTPQRKDTPRRTT
jgi:hypothetical protein